MIVILPALFLIIFLAVQGAFYYHARTVAIAAAQEGARTAAQHDSSASAGIAAATDFVGDTGDVVTRISVGGDRSATSARITVTGYSTTLLPGVKLRVSAAASAPVERVTAP